MVGVAGSGEVGGADTEEAMGPVVVAHVGGACPNGAFRVACVIAKGNATVAFAAGQVAARGHGLGHGPGRAGEGGDMSAAEMIVRVGGLIHRAFA
jgi:hypothetical protein